MDEKPKLPPLPFPLPPGPRELKGLIDNMPAVIQSVVYGIKALDQQIAAIDNAIKAVDSLLIGSDALLSGTKKSPSKITTKEEALSALKEAEITLDPDLIEKLVEYFAKSDSECPIAEYLSLALTNAKYGDKEKAKQIIRGIIDFLEGGGECGGEQKLV